jgi:hypothetical protein
MADGLDRPVQSDYLSRHTSQQRGSIALATSHVEDPFAGAKLKREKISVEMLMPNLSIHQRSETLPGELQLRLRWRKVKGAFRRQCKLP